MTNRNSTIDIARGLAMLYIIAFWHLSGYSEVFIVPYGEFLKNASLGLFMFVSGYLLGAKYKIHSVKDAWQFITKRLLRLYPLYALSLFLFWLHSAISTKTLVCSLLGISSFFPPQPPTLWFVSMLLVFYVVFVFLSGRKTQHKIIISALLYVCLFLLYYSNKAIDHRILYYFPCFFIGMIVSDHPLSKWKKGWFFVVSLCIFLLGVWLIDSRTISVFVLMRGVISLTGGFLFIFLAYWLSASQVIAKVFIPLSYASMAAYMFHRQIISFIRFIYWPEPSMWRVIFLYFVCIPVVLVAGYVIQFCYDKLIKKLKL